MEERCRKVPLPTSHNLATASDPHLRAESQPDLAPDATDDENTTKPNRMKRRMRSSSARITTNSRPEPGSFDDVVARQPPVSYEDGMVLIGQPVEAIPELLPVLRRFCGILSRNGRDGPSFFFAEQLYADLIPAPQQARIILSRDPFVAI